MIVRNGDGKMTKKKKIIIISAVAAAVIALAVTLIVLVVLINFVAQHFSERRGLLHEEKNHPFH